MENSHFKCVQMLLSGMERGTANVTAMVDLQEKVRQCGSTHARMCNRGRCLCVGAAEPEVAVPRAARAPVRRSLAPLHVASI